MVPLMDATISSFIMDWSVILSDKIANNILAYRRNKHAGMTLPFHMCSYILDALCFNSKFPILGWKWTLQDPTRIHVYHNFLWKVYFKNHVYKIFHGYMLPIYQAIFNQPPPWL